MDLKTLTHFTQGPSGFEEVHAEFGLNWFDKLLDRSAIQIFVNGPKGWCTDRDGPLSMHQTFLVADALRAARFECE